MPPPGDPDAAARLLRPALRRSGPAEVPDSKVGQLLTLLDRSGVPQTLENLLEGRPGPAGVRPRTVLAALMLSVYYTGRATVADAWRILHFSLRPRARTWLDLPEHPQPGARAHIAASRRLYRGLDRITTALDPARCDRRKRLPLHEAEALTARWQNAHGRQAAALLQRLSNQLVLSVVRMAQQHGHLRGWHGDIGVDATSIPVLARPDSDHSGTASAEITAGWHYNGGSETGIFGYSAALVIAAHRSDRPHRSRAYPQLCLGLVLDTPTARTGQNAITALTQLKALGLPTGTCAADRAYTGQSPGNFQIPARRLGYRLVLDYKAIERGPQGSWAGAPLVDGSFLCPLTPATLIEATTGADDKAVRLRSAELLEHIAAREPYHLKRKEGPDHHGTTRLQCPAAGPSPSVNCPRRARLRPTGTRTSALPQATVDLSQARTRFSHPAARPPIQLPEAEYLNPPPKDTLPKVCSASAITLRADAGINDDFRIAKYRQDEHYLSPAWDSSYKPIRSHNEGANGRFKSADLDIGNPKHRPATGQVAQTLLVALMLTVANLTTLETWLIQRTGDTLNNADFEALAPADLSLADTHRPRTHGSGSRPPPSATP
ncbi:hypothetical protein AB0G83_25330 [Streptomyces klenkii]|uniref:hypothetical protein n=1 Tax=Streptomyces klenkii TaxID=1420899 RepID=UPI0033E15827